MGGKWLLLVVTSTNSKTVAATANFHRSTCYADIAPPAVQNGLCLLYPVVATACGRLAVCCLIIASFLAQLPTTAVLEASLVCLDTCRWVGHPVSGHISRPHQLSIVATTVSTYCCTYSINYLVMYTVTDVHTDVRGAQPQPPVAPQPLMRCAHVIAISIPDTIRAKTPPTTLHPSTVKLSDDNSCRNCLLCPFYDPTPPTPRPQAPW